MKRAAIGSVFVLAVLGVSVWFIARSVWLSLQIESRVVRELELSTGAKVELQGFSFDWRKLSMRAGPVVLRGTEAAGLPPLLRAGSLEVGLSVESFLSPSVRVRSLIAARPSIHIHVAPDGTTNLPGKGDDAALAGKLVDLAVSTFELRDGEMWVNDRRTPLDLRANGVEARIGFDALAQQYRGNVSAAEVSGGPLPASFSSEFVFSRDRLELTRATVATANSSLQASGTISNWATPMADLRVQARADVKEFAQAAKRPELRDGTAEAGLEVTLRSNEWKASGPLSISDAVLHVGGSTVSRVSARADVAADSTGAVLRDLVVAGLGGEFRGQLELPRSRRFQLKGAVNGVEVPGELSARVSGPIEATGTFDRVQAAKASLKVTPANGPIPLSGSIDVEFGDGKLSVRRSELFAGDSRINVAGSLPQGLDVRIRTCDVAQLMPLLRWVSSEFPVEPPIELDGQPAELTGQITGPLSAPRLSGTFTAARLRAGKEAVQALRLSFAATDDELRIADARFERDGARFGLTGAAALSHWRLKDESTIDGRISLDRAPAESLIAALTGSRPQFSGTVTGTAAVTGTVAAPQATGSLRVNAAVLEGEKFDSLAASFNASPDRVQLTNVEAARGPDRARGSGSWTAGRAAFAIATKGWSVNPPSGLEEPLRVSGDFSGELRQAGGRWTPEALNGAVELRAASIGQANIRATTAGRSLNLNARIEAYGAEFVSDSRWSLDNNLAGGGSVRVVSLTQAAIERASGLESGRHLPFEIDIDGMGEFSGRLLEPDRLSGQLRLTTLRLTPGKDVLPAGLAAADVSVRNDGPILLAIAPTGAVIQRAKFTGPDTEIDLAGNIVLRRTNQMNLRVRGTVNLAAIDVLDPNLIATGRSSLDARVRGPLKQPRVDGRLSFENATFNFRNVSNGLDKVNGTILFDGNRASIENLRAQSGGGSLTLGGYVGFGKELSYQLQAALNDVRVRYPEGVSTQANASLTMVGTSRRSLLSGSVTVLRAGLTPATDVGGLLAKPVASGTAVAPESDFLKGLQFDLRVETAQSAAFSTELTKNVEADIDLRVRGTPARPVVLGRVSVTQGSVQFFGTDYSINRGEVSFVNPVSIDPQVDLDLETRVRGINVSISFAGPLNRMNMTYRSDPPLQSSEILALLAVGRAPTSATTLGFGSVRGNNLLSAGGSAVLSSALSQGSSAGQLQRFFGVTRLKIDPQLIGLDNTPQSRLSFEQPVSRDVTVTYSQTLARAQGQLVRVQWDLSRQWSALATRDENGVLSVDFVFRKSFK